LTNPDGIKKEGLCDFHVNKVEFIYRGSAADTFFARRIGSDVKGSQVDLCARSE
jgi:hypothetical protein